MQGPIPQCARQCAEPQVVARVTAPTSNGPSRLRWSLYTDVVAPGDQIMASNVVSNRVLQIPGISWDMNQRRISNVNTVTLMMPFLHLKMKAPRYAFQISSTSNNNNETPIPGAQIMQQSHGIGHGTQKQKRPGHRSPPRSPTVVDDETSSWGRCGSAPRRRQPRHARGT